jgi:hypothetical protein
MEHLYIIADSINKLVRSKNEKDVIKNYKKAVQNKNFNLARIIADEFSDYALLNLENNIADLSIKLYDETLEIIELNG